MMKRIWILAAVASLGACTSPEPRSTQYFEAHPEEAKAIVEACRTGAQRGDECANAEVAVETAKGKARMKRFLGKD